MFEFVFDWCAYDEFPTIHAFNHSWKFAATKFLLIQQNRISNCSRRKERETRKGGDSPKYKELKSNCDLVLKNVCMLECLTNCDQWKYECVSV